MQQPRPPQPAKLKPAKHAPVVEDRDDDNDRNDDDEEEAVIDDEAGPRRTRGDVLICCDACNLRRMPVHNTATIKWHQQADSDKPHESG